MGTDPFFVTNSLGVPLEPGRELYFPDRFYFMLTADTLSSRDVIAAKDALLERTVFITARHVAHWADRYQAILMFPPPVTPSLERTGTFPLDESAREAVIEDIFAWFKQHATPIQLTGLILTARDQALYIQHDEVPGILAVTNEEFRELQRVWRQYGLPDDLYYPIRTLRRVIEPVTLHGGVVRTYRSYTPLEWVHRRLESVTEIPVPNEQQRVALFTDACQQFMQAILLRIAELKEPKAEPDLQQVEQLAHLLHAVHQALQSVHASLSRNLNGREKEDTESR